MTAWFWSGFVCTALAAWGFLAGGGRNRLRAGWLLALALVLFVVGAFGITFLGGLVLVLLGVALHFVNVVLIGHYINAKVPGLLEADAAIDATFGPPQRGERRLWEYTAGTGIAPKWASMLGLLSPPSFAAGVIVLVVTAIRTWL